MKTVWVQAHKGSNPFLSAITQITERRKPSIYIRNSEKYSRGRRGAPAKGVGRVYRRESSNLSFSAKKDTIYSIRLTLITLYIVSFPFCRVFVPLIIPLIDF